MNETKVNETNDRPIVEGDISPYQLAKVVGVPGPMIYRYVKDGRIKCEYTETGKKVIRCGEANRWLRVYWEKNRTNK